MARDPITQRYEQRSKQKKLGELARRGMSREELEAEQAAIEKAKEQRKKAPDKYRLKAGEHVGRNDPCPCGSGKKYKKCCGAGK